MTKPSENTKKRQGVEERKKTQTPSHSLDGVPEDKFLAYGYYISSEIYNRKLAGKFVMFLWDKLSDSIFRRDQNQVKGKEYQRLASILFQRAFESSFLLETRVRPLIDFGK